MSTAADLDASGTTAGGEPLLQLQGLVAGYDGVPVVHGIDLEVRGGEVVVLLGANGAGKSTTLLTVSGLLPALGGEVRFAGQTVTQRRRATAAAVRLARSGLCHVPEDRGLFADLTVAEHLRLSRRRGDRDSHEAVLDRFPALARLADRRAGLLSGGEQQMLALARGLASQPRILLVDELSLGLAPLVVRDLVPVLRRIADEDGVGVLVVEQHVQLALSVADRAYLMRRGRIALSGSATELAARLDEVEAGYLEG